VNDSLLFTALACLAVALMLALYGLAMHRLSQRPRHRATPPSRLSVSDADVLHRAGLTLPEWDALPDSKRTDLRWRLGVRR